MQIQNQESTLKNITMGPVRLFNIARRPIQFWSFLAKQEYCDVELAQSTEGRNYGSCFWINQLIGLRPAGTAN
jgi:hypothetical protein